MVPTGTANTRTLPSGDVYNGCDRAPEAVNPTELREVKPEPYKTTAVVPSAGAEAGKTEAILSGELTIMKGWLIGSVGSAPVALFSIRI